ncbi:MAG: hypothetical protein EOO61_13855 [Hymenobacter sp.]|nr:MAG: hypothetical protein EOO61_13855 [Hymenobacter sp.]
MPGQLQTAIDETGLKLTEEELPLPVNAVGTFNYYNAFRCPHCLSPYIDIERYKEMRPKEYYGNTYINQKTTWWTG